MTIPYIYIPILAVCCYVFLLFAFLAAKKNRVIRTFMVMLVGFILWTGGSMLMRLQVFPGYRFWYEVSLLSMFSIATIFYCFIHSFIEAKGTFLRNLWIGLTALILLGTHFGLFLEVPQLVHMPGGYDAFLYDMDWRIFIPSFVVLCILVSIGVMVVRFLRENQGAAPWMVPILIGMGVMFIGNIVSILPGNIFPWDTLSAIINALITFYALYRKRLFKLTLLVSRGTVMIVTVAFSVFLLANLVSPIEALIDRYFPYLSAYRTVAAALLFLVMTLLLYQALHRLLDSIFIKDEQIQAATLKRFSVTVSRSLELQSILHELVQVVTDTLQVSGAYVCIYSPREKQYVTACAASALESRALTLSRENPLITWLRRNDARCILLKEFQRTALYKSMWETEKAELRERNIGCAVGLKDGDDVIGVLLLTNKPKHANYSYDDLSFLESVESIASIAVKNAKLYQKAYDEARTDALTGLLNRRYFYEELEAQFQTSGEAPLALVILNLDDFKLYNQLYGNCEGDIALQKIARIIRVQVGSGGYAARYSGKEFALSLPGYDARRAVDLAARIRDQIAGMNHSEQGDMLRTLTFSGGVCVSPYAASTPQQLLENADMAVFNAKHTGKNKIVVYSMEQAASDGRDLPASQVGKYAEYAPTIFALTAAIDTKDHYTFSHSQQVAEYATALARAVGLDEQHVQLIQEAALLHDVGKIGIPEHILSKPGRLTEEEFRIMKGHVESSVAIIRHLPSLDYVIPAILSHHERWDGRGYPRGLRGGDIPIAGRCLAIADSFDAMISERSYKKAMSVEYAVSELNDQAGLQFDPQLSGVFVELIRTGKIRVASAKSPPDR